MCECFKYISREVNACKRHTRIRRGKKKKETEREKKNTPENLSLAQIIWIKDEHHPVPVSTSFNSLVFFLHSFSLFFGSKYTSFHANHVTLYWWNARTSNHEWLRRRIAHISSPKPFHSAISLLWVLLILLFFLLLFFLRSYFNARFEKTFHESFCDTWISFYWLMMILPAIAVGRFFLSLANNIVSSPLNSTASITKLPFSLFCCRDIFLFDIFVSISSFFFMLVPQNEAKQKEMSFSRY